MDWKIIGTSALINAAITSVLSAIFFPIAFLGPIIGGFLASYPSKGFEDYAEMDEKDGAVVGAISGGIAGFIIALIFILGIVDINGITSLISSKIGNITGGAVIGGYIILELAIIASMVLGLIGGVIGVLVKR